jgi:hypothetical protein
MALPLPFRLVIWTSQALRWPVYIGLIAAAVGVPVLAAMRRVSPAEVVRLLFTWRAEAWDTPAGRQLQRQRS